MVFASHALRAMRARLPARGIAGMEGLAPRTAGRYIVSTLLVTRAMGSSVGGAPAAGADVRQSSGSTGPTSGGEKPSSALADAAFPYGFVAEATTMPGPGKSRNEDAYFVTRYGLGVADGVGGFSEIGIDSGAYARTLMEGARVYCSDAVANGAAPEPLAAMEAAYAAALRTPGASTACIAAVGKHPGKLIVHNLGDSALAIWRHHKPMTLVPTAKPSLVEAAKQWTSEFRTAEQCHYFNCPYQMGGNSDKPQQGVTSAVDVQPGDLGA
jgi:protein phosphatase PTC7